jgi:hypothetical protein
MSRVLPLLRHSSKKLPIRSPITQSQRPIFATAAAVATGSLFIAFLNIVAVSFFVYQSYTEQPNYAEEHPAEAEETQPVENTSQREEGYTGEISGKEAVLALLYTQAGYFYQPTHFNEAGKADLALSGLENKLRSVQLQINSAEQLQEALGILKGQTDKVEEMVG